MGCGLEVIFLGRIFTALTSEGGNEELVVLYSEEIPYTSRPQIYKNGLDVYFGRGFRSSLAIRQAVGTTCL